jgi:hypothetical protein
MWVKSNFTHIEVFLRNKNEKNSFKNIYRDCCSYGGYDHNDGTETVEVQAINREVAGKKGLAEVKKTSCTYYLKLKSAKNKNDEHDWVSYG